MNDAVPEVGSLTAKILDEVCATIGGAFDSSSNIAFANRLAKLMSTVWIIRLKANIGQDNKGKFIAAFATKEEAEKMIVDFGSSLMHKFEIVEYDLVHYSTS